MKMAIASEEERERIVDLAVFFGETVDRRWYSVPEINGVDYDEDDPEYLQAFYDECKRLAPGFMRVALGYQVLIDGCCDKSADYLKLRPDIEKLVEAGERSIQRMMDDLRDMNHCYGIIKEG